MHSSLRPVRPVPAKAVREFRKAMQLELNGDRLLRWRQYQDLLNRIEVGLGLQPGACCPLYLDQSKPPNWIRSYVELVWYWERGHLAFLDRASIIRYDAERRSA